MGDFTLPLVWNACTIYSEMLVARRILIYDYTALLNIYCSRNIICNFTAKKKYKQTNVVTVPSQWLPTEVVRYSILVIILCAWAFIMIRLSCEQISSCHSMISSTNMCSHLTMFLPICTVHIFKDNRTMQLISLLQSQMLLVCIVLVC